MKNFLLPNGFKDLLGQDAEAEFSALVQILAVFAQAGYSKISPPNLEFLSGDENLTDSKSFKFLDPISQRMLALRADITPQIARIVASRLADAPLPLRLCYYGDIFRISGMNTQADRQGKQVGLELVYNNDSAAYDFEVIKLSVEALKKLGLQGLSIDLNTPNFVASLQQNFSNAELESLRKKEYFKLSKILRELSEFSGSASLANKLFTSDLAKNLSAEALAQAEYVCKLQTQLEQANLGANFTVDFVENRSSGYQEKLSFAIFCMGAREEIGRGGKYRVDEGKIATGFSLYLNNFLALVK